MSKFVSITAAAQALGVSASTLRRWEAAGKLVPGRTEGGQRRYDLAAIHPERYHGTAPPRRTVAYAHVSSHDQKADLEPQQQLLELCCAAQGWSFEVIADFGSGMNDHKKGLKKLLGEVLDGNIGRLVLVHQDRLLCFGAELVFAICQAKEVEVVIINQGEDRSFEEEIASDVLEIIAVFSARLYGSRSHKNQKLIDGITAAMKARQPRAQAMVARIHVLDMDRSFATAPHPFARPQVDGLVGDAMAAAETAISGMRVGHQQHLGIQHRQQMPFQLDGAHGAAAGNGVEGLAAAVPRHQNAIEPA